MRIGFDAKRAFNNTSGLGNFSRNTLAALQKMDSNDQHFLFHPGKNRLHYSIPANSTAIEPKRFWWKQFRNSWRSFCSARIAKQLKLDVFHGLSNELPFGIEKSGLRSVVTIHDLIYLRFPEFFRPIDRMIYDQKFRHACKKTNCIHAISKQTKSDLIHYFGVSEKKIHLIYQSINPIYFEVKSLQERDSIRKKHQLPEKFILNVGTIERRKNLLSVIKGMLLENIDLPLVVVGKPTKYKQQIERLIENSTPAIQVIFLTGIPDSELAVIYQLAELMVYPSLFEGFGLPVAEAQASGCPVITSNLSSLPEAGGDAALYVNPESPEEIGQAIRKIISDEKYKQEMIGKGKINALRFTPEIFAKKINELYYSLVNE
jgi:glycosyltransferase involved in cell wall biosynthesis